MDSAKQKLRKGAALEASSLAKLRGRGRPTKWTAASLALVLAALNEGLPRCKAARAAGMTPDTLRRWLLADPSVRNNVSNVEAGVAKKRALYRWLHHPFRGIRPPRPPESRHLPYPRSRCLS